MTSSDSTVPGWVTALKKSSKNGIYYSPNLKVTEMTRHDSRSQKTNHEDFETLLY